MKHVTQTDVEWKSRRSPKGTYEYEGANYAIPMNAQDDGHPFDMMLIRIPPGKRPWPYHSHAGQWEFYYVMEGEGEMRLDNGPVPIREGDAMMCPPGEAHQLDNTGGGDLVIQIISNTPPVDICYYPDSDKWAAARKLFRMQDVDGYFDGEE